MMKKIIKDIIPEKGIIRRYGSRDGYIYKADEAARYISLFIAGLALWAMALCHALFYAMDDYAIFYLLLGGQLVKLGYSYGDATDETRWRESVYEAFKNLRDKK